MAENNKVDTLMFDELSIDATRDGRLAVDVMREMEIDPDRNKEQNIGKMAENNEVSWKELEEDEMVEIVLDKWIEAKPPARGEKIFCNLCLPLGSKLALYICYMCEFFLCLDCFKVHKHTCVRLQCERKERKTKGQSLLMGMRSEGMRQKEMEREKVHVYARVNVKTELDKKNCRIFGLCGLQEKRWVVLDNNNSCIKIFSSVTNTLLRYVRLGSEPRDVTEIKQKSTDPNSASGSKSGVSGAVRIEQDKQCLLAVTFGNKKQIWFIDVNKTPAIKTKTIQTEKSCYEIDFSEDKIFTLCREIVGSDDRYSVDILSAEGNPLKVIQLDFRPWDLAVYKNRIYVTGNLNNKVFCINVEDGKTISQLDMGEGSGLTGICVDHSANVYVFGQDNNKLYRLSSDLRGYEPLSLDTEYIERPISICFTDDKLIIGHSWYSSQSDFVTVVQIT